MTTDAQPTESELIRRFQSGDEEAFRVLCERCEGPLRARIERRLTRAVQRRVSVADVLQDAKLIAFQHRDDLEDRGPESFRKWLLGLVDNEARRNFKRHALADKRAVVREITQEYRPQTGAFPGGDATPSHAAMDAEALVLAREAMATLPADYQDVLRLTLLEHLTLREVAGRLGRSHDAVKKLSSRAVWEFTEAFNRLGGGSHA